MAGKCAWLGGVLPRSKCTTRVFYTVLSSQAALKALAILVALRRGVEQLKGMSVVVTVQSDSITALALVQKLAAKSSSPGLNFLGAELGICLEDHLRSFVSPPTHFHSGSEVRGEKWGNSKQAYQCKTWHHPMVFGIKTVPQAFVVTFSSAPLERAVCGLGLWLEK